LGVQGALVMISSMSVPIWNHFYVRRANNSRITTFKGVPLFRFSVRGDPRTQRHDILSRSTRDIKLSYCENRKSLYLRWSWNDTWLWQTDGRTDRITV